MISVGWAKTLRRVKLKDLENLAHPTRFERVTFAFGGQTPTPQSRSNAFSQSQEWGSCKPATTPQRASLLRATLPRETAL